MVLGFCFLHPQRVHFSYLLPVPGFGRYWSWLKPLNSDTGNGIQMGNTGPIVSSFPCPCPPAPHGCSSPQARPSPEPAQTLSRVANTPHSRRRRGCRRQGQGEPRVAGLGNTSFALSNHCCSGCLFCARCFRQVTQASGCCQGGRLRLSSAHGVFAPQAPVCGLEAKPSVSGGFPEGCPRPRNLRALPSFSSHTVFCLAACVGPGRAASPCATRASGRWGRRREGGRGVGSRGARRGALPREVLGGSSLALRTGQGEPVAGNFNVSRGNESTPHCFFLLALSGGEAQPDVEPLQEAGGLSRPHLRVPSSPLPRA